MEASQGRRPRCVRGAGKVHGGRPPATGTPCPGTSRLEPGGYGDKAQQARCGVMTELLFLACLDSLAAGTRASAVCCLAVTLRAYSNVLDVTWHVLSSNMVVCMALLYGQLPEAPRPPDWTGVTFLDFFKVGRHRYHNARTQPCIGSLLGMLQSQEGWESAANSAKSAQWL